VKKSGNLNSELPSKGQFGSGEGGGHKIIEAIRVAS